MKNLRFVWGIFLGILIGLSLFIIVKCKSGTSEQTPHIQDSYTSVEGLDNYAGNVYKLTVDNIQYIVVTNNNNGGIAIIKHK